MTAGGPDPGGRVAVIVGPTASGKSTLAEALVGRLGGEIVSADALQLYSGLDIGTAKPSPADRQRYHYHCIDLYGPRAHCTAGEFAAAGRDAIGAVAGAANLPLLVGGSGFYIDATLGRLDALPPSDPAWRAALETIAQRRGATALHRWLCRLDPERALGIEPCDQQRTLRALEVILRSGRPVAEVAASGQADAPSYDARFVGLDWPREELYRRIDERVDAMLDAGWLAEVEGLLGQGVRREDHAMQAIGYRSLCAVLAGDLSLAEARPLIARDTRRYAKRQLTYFRRRPVAWIPMRAGESVVNERVLDAAMTVLAN